MNELQNELQNELKNNSFDFLEEIKKDDLVTDSDKELEEKFRIKRESDYWEEVLQDEVYLLD